LASVNLIPVIIMSTVPGTLVQYLVPLHRENHKFVDCG